MQLPYYLAFLLVTIASPFDQIEQAPDVPIQYTDHEMVQLHTPLDVGKNYFKPFNQEISNSFASWIEVIQSANTKKNS